MFRGEKAMVFIIVLLMFLVLITIDWIRTRRKVKVLESSIVPMSASVNEAQPVPAGGIAEKYYHPGHTWVRVAGNSPVTIGSDDFARKVIGRIDDIELPQVGQLLKQGEIAWLLKSGERMLPQVAPISGKVIEVNAQLEHDPTLVNHSPYRYGWVLKLQPTELRENLRNLLHGQLAVRWMESVKAQFVRKFMPAIGTVMQDGGELIDDIGSKLSGEEWQAIVQEFFLFD
jgi:glycine cleavage system H lipoate-binding protein